MDTGDSVDAPPVRSTITVWTLKTWETAWPVCSNPGCGQEIKNGDQYIVIPGSIKMLCAICMLSLAEWQAAVSVAAEREKDRARESVRRRAAQADRVRKERKLRGYTPARTSNVPLRVCPTCQVQFRASSHGKRGIQVYCSRTCMVRRKSRLPIPCPVCGRMFTPTHTQTACSHSCARLKQEGKTRDTPLPKAWSLKYPACRDCGATAFPHIAHGYCRPCYRHRKGQKE